MPDDAGLAGEFEKFRSGKMSSEEAAGYRRVLRDNPELLDEETRRIVAEEHLLDEPNPTSSSPPAAEGPSLNVPQRGSYEGLDSLGARMNEEDDYEAILKADLDYAGSLEVYNAAQRAREPPKDGGFDPLPPSEGAVEPLDPTSPVIESEPEPAAPTAGLIAAPALGVVEPPTGRWGCRIPILGIVIFGVGVIVLGAIAVSVVYRPIPQRTTTSSSGSAGTTAISGPSLRLTLPVPISGALVLTDTKCYNSGLGWQWNAAATVGTQKVALAMLPSQKPLGGGDEPLLWIRTTPDLAPGDPANQWYWAVKRVSWDVATGAITVRDSQVATGITPNQGSVAGTISGITATCQTR